MFCLFKGGIGGDGIILSEFCPSYIIIGKRIRLCGLLQDVDTLLPQSCLGIVERQFVIVVDIVVHQFVQVFQRLFCQQVLLVHTAIIEAVELQRLTDPCQRLVFSSKFPQGYGFHGAGFVVVAVADERTFQFVEGVLPALVSHADTGCLEESGIGPRLVPRRLPETIVSLPGVPEEFMDDAQIEQRFAIVGVGITLLQNLNGSLQIGLRLFETGTTQVP